MVEADGAHAGDPVAEDRRLDSAFRCLSESGHSLQPQDAMSLSLCVPNLPVDVDSWGRSACYPASMFMTSRHIISFSSGALKAIINVMAASVLLSIL